MGVLVPALKPAQPSSGYHCEGIKAWAPRRHKLNTSKWATKGGNCMRFANASAQPPVAAAYRGGGLYCNVWAAIAAIGIQIIGCSCPAELMPPAHAILSSPNALIARNANVALRRATPAFNADVKQVQAKLEDIGFLLRIPQRKPWGSMVKDLSDVKRLVADTPKMLNYVPTGKDADATVLLENISSRLDRLQFAIDRKDPDKTSVAVADALKLVSDLEIMQAPALPFRVPQAYANAPLLTGRAQVRFVVEKANGFSAFVDSQEGGMLKQGTFVVTVDGYSAPVSAGAFVRLVLEGKYDGCEWAGGYASVVAGGGISPGSTVPLEILPIGAVALQRCAFEPEGITRYRGTADQTRTGRVGRCVCGDLEPVYRSPLDIRGGELPVLPLSIRGAISMSRLPDVDGYLSGDEFFIFKFDNQQAGLSGLAFDEGEFGVFGYVTEGMDDVVAKLVTGDKIVSATLISGKDRLINIK